MRREFCLLAAAVVAASLCGCGESKPDVVEPRMTVDAYKYQRIAIVAAPAEGAVPEYARDILDAVRPRVPSRLRFLANVDCLDNIEVDTTAVPPRVDLGARASSYDGIVCLVYAYSYGWVYLNIHVIDAATGAQVWRHQLKTQDPNTAYRLKRQGTWAPTVLKLKFYDYHE